MSETGPDPVSNVRTEVAGPSPVRYGPQLSLDELRKQCARVAADGTIDIHFRHYLNQFALWAHSDFIVSFAAALAQPNPISADNHDIARRLLARADEQERNNSYPVDRALDREAAAALSALKSDRNAVIEECALVVDAQAELQDAAYRKLWAEKMIGPFEVGSAPALRQAAKAIRAMIADQHG